jgi:hypothetical protein
MNEFNQLWDGIAIMVDFEAKRIENNSGKVNIQQISRYYKTEIIEKLWFNFTLQNKYNEWVYDCREKSPAICQAIRNKMDSFSPAPQRKPFPVLLAAGIAIMILGLLSFALPELNPVISTVIAIAGAGVATGGFVQTSNQGKYCDRATLSKELNRIKNQINTIIHEHENSK